MVHKPRRDLNPLEMDGHAKVMCHGKQKYVSTQGNPEIWGKTKTTKKKKKQMVPRPRLYDHLHEAEKASKWSPPD